MDGAGMSTVPANSKRSAWKMSGPGLSPLATNPIIAASTSSGFAKAMVSTCTQYGAEPDGQPWRKVLTWHENPFTREIVHWRECILEGLDDGFGLQEGIPRHRKRAPPVHLHARWEL